MMTQDLYKRVHTCFYRGYVIRIYKDMRTGVDYQWRIFDYAANFIAKDDETWNYQGQSKADAENYIDQVLKP